MASNDIYEWYVSIPQLSKYWFTGSVVLPLMGKFGFLNPKFLILSFYFFIYEFQIWRPITALFYYPINPFTGFQYLVNLYFLYTYSTRLETGVFESRPADYAFMLIFNWLCLVILGLIGGLSLLMLPMVFSVIYVWCQVNKDYIVRFWFGIQIKAMYLPWMLLVFNMITHNGGFVELLGILVGHLYFFLKFKYPQDFGGSIFLNTPSILYRFLPSKTGYGTRGFGATPARGAAARQDEGGHRWGRGNALGDN